jgi:hypothetical protein
MVKMQLVRGGDPQIRQLAQEIITDSWQAGFWTEVRTGNPWNQVQQRIILNPAIVFPPDGL